MRSSSRWPRRVPRPRLLGRIASRSALVLFLALGGAGTLPACEGRAATASERLRDAVVGYNDELRFGRNDLAVQRVSGAYRGAFIGGHYRWGREIQIADVEIVNVEAAGDEGERATSFVTVRWFVQANMIVRESLIRQEWEKHSTQYVLQSERIIDGDATLLAVPEGFRPETSGLDAHPAPAPSAGEAGAGATESDTGTSPND